MRCRPLPDARRIIARSAIGLVVAAALHAPGDVARASQHPQIGTKVGQLHPDFRLPNLDGGFRRLSDYRGKKVLLLHFASW